MTRHTYRKPAVPVGERATVGGGGGDVADGGPWTCIRQEGSNLRRCSQNNPATKHNEGMSPSTGPLPPKNAPPSMRDHTPSHGMLPPTHPTPPNDAPTPTHARRSAMYDTLTFASLNVGGVELHGFRLLPHTLSLQEFRPSSSSHITDHKRVAML